MQDLQNNFTTWAKKNGIKLSAKVSVSATNVSHRFGLVAIDDISTNETLFEVPRPMLLNVKNSNLGKIIKDYDKANKTHIMHGSPSGWVPLLLTLMYELSNGSSSQWSPYLKLIPKGNDMLHPHVWTDEQRNSLLTGLRLKEDVDSDLKNIESEFSKYALPFIRGNTDKFSDEYSTKDAYIKLACFVMAYSFTEEDGHVSMVPMADILNHHSNNNAHLVFGKKALAMTSTKSIKKGEEVFNTFGNIGNEQLLQMYGYVESNNPFDQVSVPLIDILSCYNTHSNSKPINNTLNSSKWEYLQRKMDVESTDTVDISMRGVIDGKQMAEAIKALTVNQSEFRTLSRRKSNEDAGWEFNGPSKAKQSKANDDKEYESENTDDSDTDETDSSDDDDDNGTVDLESFTLMLTSNGIAALKSAILSAIENLGEINLAENIIDDKQTLVMKLKNGHRNVYNNALKYFNG